MESLMYEQLQTPSQHILEDDIVLTPNFSPITLPPTPCTGELNNEIWMGFKMVGDNIDKTLHRRHQTHEKQTVSMHYFHYYAVMDRIDLSHFSDIPPEKPLHIDGNLFLPTKAGIEGTNKDFCTYIER